MMRKVRTQLEFPIVVVMLVFMRYSQRGYDAFYEMSQHKLFKWQWRILDAIFKWRSK